MSVSSDRRALQALIAEIIRNDRALAERVMAGGRRRQPTKFAALIMLARYLLELQARLREAEEKLAEAVRERDAVADLMDDDLDAAAAEDGHGEVRGV